MKTFITFLICFFFCISCEKNSKNEKKHRLVIKPELVAKKNITKIVVPNFKEKLFVTWTIQYKDEADLWINNEKGRSIKKLQVYGESPTGVTSLSLNNGTYSLTRVWSGGKICQVPKENWYIFSIIARRITKECTKGGIVWKKTIQQKNN